MTPARMTPRQIIAATAWGEARGDTTPGEDAVIAVLVNRAKIAARYKAKRGADHPLYGDGTIVSACLVNADATYPQFDCWRQGDPNRAKIEALDFDHPDPELEAALEAADEALDGTLCDPTNSSTHYKVTTLPWPKSWGPQIPARAVIGHHSFYQIP